MKNARMEAYWGIHHGERRMLSEMPPTTYHIVFQYLKEGEAVGQYTLPFEGGTDLEVSMPGKVNERQVWEEERIKEIRGLLKNGVRIE